MSFLRIMDDNGKIWIWNGSTLYLDGYTLSEVREFGESCSTFEQVVKFLEDGLYMGNAEMTADQILQREG